MRGSSIGTDRMHDLHRLAAANGERGAPGLVTRDDIGEGRLQGGHVERTAPDDECHLVVHRRLGSQLREPPHRALHDRERSFPDRLALSGCCSLPGRAA